MRRMLSGLVLVAACGGGGGGGDDDHDAAAPDARVIDAVPEFDAPDLDAAPGVTHTLFLNFAVGPATCTARDNMIAFVFDGDTNVHDDAWEAIAVFGLLHAIPISSLAGDCMCFADGNCLNAPLSQTCTIGGADTPMSSQETCE